MTKPADAKFNPLEQLNEASNCPNSPWAVPAVFMEESPKLFSVV